MADEPDNATNSGSGPPAIKEGADVANPFNDFLGIEIVEAVAGECMMRLALRPEHMNPNDVAHGGVVSTLIDAATGTAVRTLLLERSESERVHVTVDLHVTYLAPAFGKELVAKARVMRGGRTAVFSEAEVRDDTGRVVARGTVTYLLVVSPSPRGS